MDFISESRNACILDVRSEGEHSQGHIPGAISFPLLNNEERKLVGTCYKEKGNFEAVLLGYELVGPRFSEIIKDAKAKFGEKLLYIHCWRGGLRSRIMANLLSSAGFSVCILKGGYKSYRNYVQDVFLQPFRFLVLSGYTGSGKTEVLHFLKDNGKQVIDLENLANHRGSAFGGLGFTRQPTQEQFENKLAHELSSLNSSDKIWIEDESRLIGNLQIPSGIYENYRKCGLYFMDIPLEKRCGTILKDYGYFKKEELILSTIRIKKKLGDLRTRLAIEAIEKGELLTWVKEVLYYYDKAYNTGLKSKNNEFIIRIEGEMNDIKKELLSK
ncbi:MAG: tRNA 2-selenouridine(34) synthase MnmH [Bacteroidia bacterium]